MSDMSDMSDMPMTFEELLAQRCTPEEQIRIRALLADRQRRLPEEIIRCALVRAMATVIGGPLTCGICGCPTLFIDEDDQPPGQPDVDACPLCNPALALSYMRVNYLTGISYPESRE